MTFDQAKRDFHKVARYLSQTGRPCNVLDACARLDYFFKWYGWKDRQKLNPKKLPPAMFGFKLKRKKK